MKKLLVLALLCAVCHKPVAAQTAAATTIAYNKVSRPGLMLELPYSESISQDFIVANLKKTGYDAETKGKLFWKQNKLNGYYIFKGVMLDGADQRLDLYFKVDPKGSAKDASVIYLLVSKGDENFISSASDPAIYEASKRFLNGFVDLSAAYKLDRDIQDQEAVVKEAEKKMEKLKDNEKDMVKKKEQLEKDLQKNKEDQDSQIKTIDSEKKKLAGLKTQVKS